jgi:acyl-CoA dehydrogenase
MTAHISNEVLALAERVEVFVRATVFPYEQIPLRDTHGPTEEIVEELRQKARAAGVLTPHIRPMAAI